MLAGEVSDSEGGINADCEEVLKDSGEQDGVAKIEQRIGAAFVTSAPKVISLGDVVGIDAPKETGRFGFLSFSATIGEEFEFFEASVFGSEFLREGELVPALSVDCFLPKTLSCLCFEADLSAS